MGLIMNVIENNVCIQPTWFAVFILFWTIVLCVLGAWKVFEFIK